MVNPFFKKLFSEKTDSEILYHVYNPCEHCDFYDDCQNCAFNRIIKELEKEGNKMKIIYTRPTLTLSEKDYNSFETVRNVLYELSMNTNCKVIKATFDNFDSNDKVNYRNLGENIDYLYELIADFVSFIDKYGKVVSEDENKNDKRIIRKSE